jgi:hypothetical protein
MIFVSNENCTNIDRKRIQSVIEHVASKKAFSHTSSISAMYVIRGLEQQAQMLSCHLHQAVFRLAMLGELPEVVAFFDEYPDAKEDFAHTMGIFGEVFGQQELTSEHMANLLTKWSSDEMISGPSTSQSGDRLGEQNG